VLILPGTDKKAAKVVAEKIRRLVEQSSFPFEEKLPSKRITISVGVSSFPQDTDDEEEFIKLTDQALYKAKKSGRNRTVTM
jgi:two-component system cell cycle response regulator